MKISNLYKISFWLIIINLNFKLINTEESEKEPKNIEESITIKNSPESKEIEKEIDVEKKLDNGYLKEQEKEAIDIKPETITEKKSVEKEIVKENKNNKNLSDIIEKFENIDDADELLDDIEKEFSLEDIR